MGGTRTGRGHGGFGYTALMHAVVPSCIRAAQWVVLLLCLGCERLAEHVDPDAGVQGTGPLELADIAGQWRVSCALDLLSSVPEGEDVYVLMRLVIPQDGTAESGGVMGVTRFADPDCSEDGEYAARPVSYALDSMGLSGDVVVLHAVVDNHASDNADSLERWVGLYAAPDRQSLYFDTDGEADRTPHTEVPEDPEAAYGWFVEDPEGRGIIGIRLGDPPSR